MRSLPMFLCLLTCLIAFEVEAQQKAKYNLFKPVPKSEMREMATDRPGVTETPITVDAGHFQYETGLFTYGIERAEGTKTKSYTFNDLDLHIGLTTSTGLQVLLGTYVVEDEKERSTGMKSRESGIGDLTFRVKQNLRGNDGQNFAIAILPYITLPTAKYNDNNKVQGGLMVPLELKLPSEWTLGFQMEVDRLQDKDADALHTEFLQALSLNHSLIGDLDGLAETYQIYEFKKHQWTNYVNAALQYSVNSSCKLDVGLSYGIQRDAERSCYLGLAYRF